MVSFSDLPGEVEFKPYTLECISNEPVELRLRKE